VVLLTSLYLDATLRVGGSEEKEEVCISIRFKKSNVYPALITTFSLSVIYSVVACFAEEMALGEF